MEDTGQGLKVSGVVAMALEALNPMLALYPMPPPQPQAPLSGREQPL